MAILDHLSMSGSIRGRLLWTMMTVSTVAVLLAGSVLVGFWVAIGLQEGVRDLEIVAEMIADQSRGAVAFLNPDDAMEVLETLRAANPVVGAWIYDENGALFAEYLRDGGSLQRPVPAMSDDGVRFGQRGVIAVHTVELGGYPIGKVCIFSDLSRIGETMKRGFGAVLAAIVIAAGAAFFTARRMQAGITDPILLLADTAREVSETGDHSIRAERISDDEIGRLTEAFNRMLDEIEESEARTRRLLNANVLGVVVANADGWIVEANDHFLAMVGYEQRELPIRWDSMTPPEYAAKDVEILDELARTGIATPWTKEYFRKDGSRVPMLVGGAMLEPESDQILCFMVDLSAQKRAEADLRLKNIVFESSLAGNSIADPDGTITATNPAFARMWGFGDKNEPPGMSIVEFFADPDEAVPILTALNETGSWEGEFRAKRADGTTFISHGQATTVHDENGELIGYQSANIDVTAEAEANERLKNTLEHLEHSNRELSKFAFVASHDLQEPVRTVTSYLQLLEHRYGDRLDGEAREFMGFAIDGARKMKAMVNSYLEFSRVSSGRGSKQEVDLNTLMARVVWRMSSVVEESDADVSWDRLPTVEGDESQLAQTLCHLVENAIKFKGADAPRVRVSATEADDTWRISVEDNGIGFDEKYGDRVFEIFQRLNSASQYPGTGAGLAICRRIIELHGGTIWAESRPGHGSTFSFTIPKRAEQA